MPVPYFLINNRPNTVKKYWNVVEYLLEIYSVEFVDTLYQKATILDFLEEG